jgi:Zn-dependent peptidase ImmA (M78 family)
LRRGFKSWADKKAVEYRKVLGKKYFDILSARELANYLDIDIITPREIPGLENTDASNLLNHDNNSWSGITVKNQSGSFIIIVNPTHSSKRQESDLMHEIAHIICEHKMEKIQIRTDFPFPLRDYDHQQEDEAKWFGGCLQIPRDALVHMLYRGYGINEISDHFGASLDMVKYRINITGVKKQFQN